jgi:hypothetical protein
VLPRIEGTSYISLIEECGGHTNEYHFHERMSHRQEQSRAHSVKIGVADDGKPRHGKWEDADNHILLKLDACGRHW